MISTKTAKSFALSAVIGACVGLAHAASVQTIVDETHAALGSAAGAADMEPVASIDHARLASAEGVEMPPSRVQIFSDPSINIPILSENIRAGLDLPFRVLSYGQDGVAKVTYTGAEFLQIRHGLADETALAAFEDRLRAVIGDVDAVAAPTERLTLDYGIIELKSALSVPEAVASLADVVTSQDDTVWFGEIDYAAQASDADVDLPDAILLLFGGPGPGGVAMAQFPAIGLDAFCQKLLVYAGEDGGSVILFNDIAAFSELHYGASAEPHHALNERLTATFQSAIE